MSATVQQIAEALEGSLTLIDGLRTAPYLSDSITPPVALVAIEDIEYHQAFRDAPSLHTFTIFLIVGRASDRAGIQNMESFMSATGDNSIKAAIETDTTLGGVVSTSIVTKAGPPAQLAIGTSGAVYIAVPFTISVYG